MAVIGDETTNETGSEAQRQAPSATAAPPNAERWLSAWATFLIAVPLMLAFMVNAMLSDDMDRYGMLLAPVAIVLLIMLILGAACWISAVLLVAGDTAYRLVRRQSLDEKVSPFFWASSALVVAYGLWVGWHVWM